MKYKDQIGNENLETYINGYDKRQGLKEVTAKGKTKMTSVRESSATYESKETKNISELKSFDIDTPMQVREYTDSNDVAFEVNEVIVDDEAYRVPNSVLKQIKALIGDNPELKKVKVLKTGSGLKTSYQVIPQ